MQLGLLMNDALEKYTKKGVLSKEESGYKAFVNELPAAIKSYLKEKISNPYEWTIEGSVGKGKWADTPWIGIYLNKVTDRASYGFYIALLAGRNSESFTLAIANSVTDDSLSLSTDNLKNINLPMGWKNSKIASGTLSDKKNSLGSDYESAAILHKTYSRGDLHTSDVESDLLFLIEIYQNLAKIKLESTVGQNYWLLGAMWEDQDVSEKFINESRWENGYKPTDNDSSTERVKHVKIGDQVAIKSSFAQGGGGVLRIKAVGVVTENPGDGVRLSIKWNFKGPHFDIRGTSYRTTIDKLVRADLQKLIFHNNFKDSSVEKEKKFEIKEEVKLPKNLILYGPPGVGKTYQISQLRKQFESNDLKSSSLSAWIENLSWWEVAAITLNDLGRPSRVTDMIEHEFVKLKATQSSNSNIRATLWGNLQSHTDPTNPNVKVASRSEPFIFSKDEESNWSLATDSKNYIIELLSTREDLSPAKKMGKRYEFVTFHQSLSYEDFVEGIRPVLREGGGISYELHNGVFKRICARAISDPKNNYAIFIDEINRGNISKIFGELITLIEEDKRISGKADDLYVTLPYSKSEFGVPENLHIIGTMNSADRSIAIMDTALRRRFEFKEVRPLLDRIPEKIEQIEIRKIVSSINQLISKNLSPDYELGHAYFEQNKCSDIFDLIRIWNHQILPLLKEYFWDNSDQLKNAIGPFLHGIEDENQGLNISSPRINFISNSDEFKKEMLKLEKHLDI